MLSINLLNVCHGQIQILWDLTLSVDRGEIVAIIGSNGAGKSTLLNTISGLLSPRSGEILFQEKTLHGLSPSQVVSEGIILIPEGRHLFPQMSVEENLEMGCYKSSARKHRANNLTRVYELFPILRERRKQTCQTLSGGEQQMLAIGRALMSQPTFLMLDEPSTGLSPKLVHWLFDIIRELHNDGLTIFLVEQNIHYALRIGHRAYLIENGRVSLTGKAEVFLNNDHVQKTYLGL